MKKILILFVAGLFILSGIQAVGQQFNEFEVKTNHISFSKPDIKYEKGLAQIEIKETNTYLRNIGKPLIPSYVETFSFPFGTKIKKVTCEVDDFQDSILSQRLKPSMKVAAIGSINVKQDFDSINYGNEPYPETWYDFDVGCGRNGHDLNIFVKVEVFPIRYYAVDNLIRNARNVKISIEYETPTQSLIFNDEYDFVVIGPEEFADELDPFINHKLNRGISTIFVSLSDVYDGIYFPDIGRDSPEKIKYFIKNAIEEWGTDYVLFVGGNLKVPTRNTHVYINHPDDPDDEVFVSDLYYVDIYDGNSDFCSWDSNENDVFGEFNWTSSHNYDQVDLYPDVFFGRLACADSSEVTTCVDKIIKYENDAAYSQDWFKDMVVIGGDTWVPHSGDDSAIPEGEFINEHILDVMYDFDAEKIWDTNGRLGTWIPPYGSGDITTTVGRGCGFLEWSGHGHINVWATHRHEGPPGNWIPTPLGQYTSTNVQALANGDELPIVVIGGCSCGKFNANPGCFAWLFVSNPDGGGIASIASTGLLYSAFGNETIEAVAGLIEINTFKAYKDLNAITLGEMWAWSVKEYIDTVNLEMNDEFCYDYKTMEQWECFGDPTLAIGPESQAPLKPNPPNGPDEGSPNVEYTFFASTTDPDDDDIYYLFDWGNGETSGWIGPFESGEQVTQNYTWNFKGTFSIKVRSKDIHGDQSEWSEPLRINIPRAKLEHHFRSSDLLNRFSNLIPVLKLIIQLF